MLTDRPLTDVDDRPRAPASAPRGKATTPVSGDRGVPGERLERLAKRRRLLREELFVVIALLLILAVTVAILAAQWLASGPSAGAASGPSAGAFHLFVHLDPGGTT